MHGGTINEKSQNGSLGIIILIIGVIIGLNALEITNIDILFDGWWTLFIIVPCLIDLFTSNATCIFGGADIK